MTDDTTSLHNQMVAHRATLAILLRQVATHTEAYAPLAQLSSIAEARAQIAQLKVALRAAGVAVDDQAGDVAGSDDGRRMTPSPSVQGAVNVGGGQFTGAGVGTNYGTINTTINQGTPPPDMPALLAATQALQAVVNHLDKLPTAQSSRSFDNERSERWPELIERLCKLETDIDEEKLFCLQLAFWPKLERVQHYENASDLFVQIIRAAYSYRPFDYSHFLAFVHLVGEEAKPLDQGLLEVWVKEASAQLNISREHVLDVCEDYRQRYTLLLHTPASLMIVVREEQPGKGYTVTASLTRPAIGERMCGERIVVSAAAELRELLKKMLTEEHPPWLGNDIWIEFILPETLLIKLGGDWRFGSWKYEKYNPVRKCSMTWTLGIQYPIIVRCTERLFASDWEPFRQAWRTKAKRLAGWLHMQREAQHAKQGGAAAPEHPRITCIESSNPNYIPVSEWDYKDVIALIAPDAPEALQSDCQEMVFTLLENGLPVGLWFAPDADIASSSEYMAQYFAAEQLHSLPHYIRAQRGYIADPRAPAANLVLFWDEVDHEPPEWPFSSPRGRA